MPKVIMEFDSVEDKDDIHLALHGWKFRYILRSVMEDFIRQKLKYDEKTTKEQQRVLEELRKFITDELESQEISLN